MREHDLKSLLLLYCGMMLMNLVASLLLRRGQRSELYSSMAMLWGFGFFSFLIQAWMQGSNRLVAIGFLSMIPHYLAMGHLLSKTSGLTRSAKSLFIPLPVAFALGTAAWIAGLPFAYMTVPVAFAAILYPAGTALRVLRLPLSQSSVSLRGLALSVLLSNLHILDYPFLRNSDFAPIGFTVAILLVFAISVFAPAAVLERLTNEKLRIEIEKRSLSRDLELAGAAHKLLLPPGKEILTPNASLTANFASLRRSGAEWWVCDKLPDGRIIALLGDVTGEGVGAAMIAASANSCYKLLLELSPDIGISEIFRLLDKHLYQNAKGDYWMALAGLEIDPRRKLATWLNAGTPPIHLIRGEDQALALTSQLNPLGSGEGRFAARNVRLTGKERFGVFSGRAWDLGLDPTLPSQPTQIAQMLSETLELPPKTACSAITERIKTREPRTDAQDVAFLLLQLAA